MTTFKVLNARVVLAVLACVFTVSAASAKLVPGLKFGYVTDTAGYGTVKVPETWSTVYDLQCTTNYNASVNTTSNTLWSANRVNFYEGEMFFDGGTYRFGYKMYYNAQVYVDGVLFGDCSDNVNGDVYITEALRPARGWHTVKFVFRSGANGAAGPYTYTVANWSGACGLGLSRAFAYMPSKSGDKYAFFHDEGTGNLFRHDDGEAGGAELQILARGYPEFGLIRNDLVIGTPVGLSAPSAPAGHVCSGFRLTVDGAVTNGTAKTVTYTPASTTGVPLLEWLFERENTLTFACDPAKGSVAPADATVRRTGTVTVTATPAAGYKFLMWQGDAPERDIFKATIDVPGNKPRAMTAVFTPDVVLTAKTYIGSDGIWETASNWNPAGAPTIADAVTVNKSGAKVLIAATAEAGSLLVGNGAILSINATSANAGTFPRVAADTSTTAPWGIRVAGDMEIAGASKVYLGGFKQANRTYVEVAGNLNLSGSTAVLGIFAGPTNAASGVSMRYGGANLVVGGTTTIASGARIRPAAHSNSSGTYADYIHNQGNPVVMSLQNLVVDAGGYIDANHLGYQGKPTGQPNAWERRADMFTSTDLGSGNRSTTSAYVGGSYGGKGGLGFAKFGYELAPCFPGVSGGNGSDNVKGGGAVRIYARNITLNGTIQADGQPGGYTGGASGGGVWLLATEGITAGRNSVISANASQGTVNSYGAGGGRIAAGIGVTEAQVDDLFATGYAEDLAIGAAAVAGLHGTVAAARSKGVRYDLADGEPGTVFGYVNLKGSHKLTIAATDTGNLAYFSATPGFGVKPNDGSITSATVGEYAYDNAGSTRWQVTGYTITADDTSATLASGAGTNVVAIPAYAGDITLTWTISEAQRKITTAVLGDTAGGSVAVDGDDANGWVSESGSVTITASTVTGGMEFQYWIGDIPEAERYSPAFTLDGVPRALNIRAFFGGTTGETLYAKNQAITDWFATSNWQTAKVPGTNDTAILGTDLSWRNVTGGEFLHVGSLVVSNAILNLNVNCTATANRSLIQASLNAAPGNPVALVVTRDLVTGHANSAVMMGGARQGNFTRLLVGGDVTMAAGVISVNAGCDEIDITQVSGAKYRYNSIAEMLFGNNKVTVGGTLKIKSGATFFGRNDSRTGAALHYKLAKLDIDAGGTLSAAYGGYRNFVRDGSEITCCPSGISVSDDYNSMAYGGYGTIRNNTTSYNTAYNKYGYANAPYHPGAPNASMRTDATINCAGGGSIRMDAGEVVLNGTVTTESNSSNKGGGSGGGIWINAGQYTFGANARVSVKGGNNSQDAVAGGNGGGGRAALCENLTEAQIWALATNATHIADEVVISSLADKLGDAFDCSGGIGPGTIQGESGTGVYIANTAGKVVLHVDGSPAKYGAGDTAFTPAYGANPVTSGEELSFTAPESALVDASTGAHAFCSGWTITNMLGATIASGSGTSGAFTPDGEAVLTWNWVKNYYGVTVGATVGGSIATNAIANPSSIWQKDNTPLNLTAVPAAGYRFVAWVAEGLDTAMATSSTLATTVTRGYFITAHFSKETAETVTWTGAAGDNRWLNAANWNGGYVPGSLSEVVFPAGATVTIGNANLITFGALTVEAGATLNVRNRTFSTFTTLLAAAVQDDYNPVKLAVAGDVNIAGTFAIGSEHSLSQPTVAVGGDLAVAANATMTVYAGWADVSTASGAGWRAGGGTISVGGSTTVAGTLVAGCEGLSGVSVRFILNALEVAATGVINADTRGFFLTTISGLNYFNGPGTPSVSKNWNAASHGGVGGKGPNANAASPSTVLYGNARGPYLPGSAGWNRDYMRGGGAVRIEARSVRHRGAITAIGRYTTESAGAGSGGAIWICAASYRSYDGSLLSVRGGNSANNSGYGGPGGGGRICIAVGFSDAQIDGFYAAGQIPNHYVTTDLAAETVADVAGSLVYSGGAQNGTSEPAGSGTALHLKIVNPTLLILR